MEEIGTSQLITPVYFEQCMRDVFGPKAVLGSYELEKLSVGQGFYSQIIRAKLNWKNGDYPKSLVVKVPSSANVAAASKQMDMGQLGVDLEQMAQQFQEHIRTLHRVECTIYELFKENSPIPMPKYYLARRGTPEEPAVLILEDLSEKATVPCLAGGMTLDQTMQATSALAKLHGWSIVTQSNWRNDLGGVEDLFKMFVPILASIDSAYKKAIEKYPDVFGSLDMQLAKQFLKMECIVEYANMHKQFMEDVMIHGDFWAHNLLFEKKSDGSVGEKLMAVIDFQQAMKGNPMFDLARLMSLCVNEDIRRNHTVDILQHYLVTVQSVAGKKFTTTHQQLQELYERLFPFFTFLMLPMIPMLAETVLKSQGEERKNDFNKILKRMKAICEDAVEYGKKYAKGSPMFDLARLMTVSVPENIRRNHIDHILQHYYNTLKTVAGDQFSASLHQLELLYHQQFAHFTFFILRAFPVILKAAVKSEGEEWTNDFSILSARMKAAYDDATMTMEKCCS